MDLNRYRFHSEWPVSSDCGTTYAVLRDIGSYAKWWPEVKRVAPLDMTRASVRITGVLPYSLNFVLQLEADDPDGKVLRVSLQGDLDGWSSWRLLESPDGCRLLYDQEVVVRKRLLRVLAPVARPIFRLNHALMMRRGRRGLCRWLV